MARSREKTSSKGQTKALDRIVAVGLLLSSVVLVLGYLWWGRFEYYRSFYLAAAYVGSGVILLVNQLYFRESLKQQGLRLDNLGAALRESLVPHLLILLPLGGWLLVSGAKPDLGELPFEYLPWAFLQQYVLQNLVRSRFQTILGGSVLTVLSSAVLFAGFHLPNAGLVVFTFAGSLIWCALFQRVPNLLSVSLSHALLGIIVVVLFKFNGLNQLEVGKGGIAYTTFGGGVIVAGGYDADGEPFVATLPGQDRSSPSLVRLFRPDGTFLKEWLGFEEYGFSGNLAAGDIGFGPGDEIVIAPGPGTRNPPLVRVFSLSGERLSQFRLEGFDGYGAFVAVSEGTILVTPGPGPGRGASVFEFRADGTLVNQWLLGDIGFHNSVRVQRIPGSPDSNLPGARLLLFANFLSVNSSVVKVYDTASRAFSTWDTIGSAFGLNLAPLQLGPYAKGIVTAPGAAPGHSAHIMVLDREGNQLSQFFADAEDPPCGCSIASLDVDGDQVDELVLGEGICPEQPPTVRVVDLDQNILAEWEAY